MKGHEFTWEQLSSNGRPVLLIGGVNTAARHWKPYIDLLSPARTVILVTLATKTEASDIESPLNVALADSLRNNGIFEADIISFSMGSRLALWILGESNLSVEKILCIAPDGIVTHSAFFLATQTSWGRALFKYIMHRSRILKSVGQVGWRLRLLNKQMFSLLTKLGSDKDAAMGLYAHWLAFGTMQPAWQKINAILRAGSLNLTFLFGRTDFIISSSISNKCREICPMATVAVVETGHAIKDQLFVQYAKKMYL